VHNQTRLITASKYIFKERRRVFTDPGVMEVDRVTGSKHLAGPRVDRHHLICIWSYLTTKRHALSCPAVGLVRAVRDFVESQRRVLVSYLLTWFLLYPRQNLFLSWILFGSCERCSRELMVGSLPSSSIIWGLQVVHLYVHSMGVSRCSSKYARLPSAARLTICIYI